MWIAAIVFGFILVTVSLLLDRFGSNSYLETDDKLTHYHHQIDYRIVGSPVFFMLVGVTLIVLGVLGVIFGD